MIIATGKLCGRDDWLVIKPEYIVEVRQKLPLDSLPPYAPEWTTVTHIRFHQVDWMAWNDVAYIQCMFPRKQSHILYGNQAITNIGYRDDIRVEYKPQI